MEERREIPDHALGEVPNHKLEEVLVLVSHVAPVAMLLPLRAPLAVLAHLLHDLD